MLTQLTFLSLAMAAGMVQTALVPTKPGPNESFNTGSDCKIEWSRDTTGTWTSFTVDLMSGSNLAMQTVMNVFKGHDGTKEPNSYTFTCPDVTPNAAIYFYQFSQAGAETTWTTRFTIASASGQSTTPANANQPAGQAIPWGVGRLTSASAANATIEQLPSNGNMTALKKIPDSTNTTAATLNVTSIANSTNLNTSTIGSSSTTSTQTNKASSAGKTASSATSSSVGQTTAQTPATSGGSALTLSSVPCGAWILAGLLLIPNML